MSKDMLTDNNLVQPLLTDLYQINMAYAYWKAGKTDDHAVFDLFFRKNPFQGEFTIFAGLEQCIKFLDNFQYTESDIEYLKQTLPSSIDDEFFLFLSQLNTKGIILYAIDEGSVVFPRVPMIRVEGPLVVVQLIETTFLTLVNFASLMTTNAARYRMAAGDNVSLLEFGLRRAQGPDGGLSASKYAYMGGFDGTSNVLAGKMFNIPVKGTHAHAFINSFTDFAELKTKIGSGVVLDAQDIFLGSQNLLNLNTGESEDLLERSIEWRKKVAPLLHCNPEQASDGELTALISFAVAFPYNFVALIDTYDVSRSGLLNFSAVALALNDLGYQAIGIRIDSGDLAYLSSVSRNLFITIAKQFNLPWFANLQIVASNDINEETIWSLNDQNHKIDCFGIGTNLVTCQKQPALGCVYKLVELNGIPRIKLSQDAHKITMPGKKDVYRLYGSDGYALCDLLQRSNEDAPKVGEKVLCRHPVNQQKRAFATPSGVEPLLKEYWKNGELCRKPLPSLSEIRQRVRNSLKTLRQDHKRYLNPTPYKVSVSDNLYHFINEMWLQNAPIGDLS
ncbi:nicotinate phosphoribosyltransferase-like isoform X1 [Planococcus citri]|uniref:nicotinate phosphoribosyltransferase-like isoform X1 n=1 Tax=Planococcus citri TaxID=170843 RepID=UPI0031F72FD9